MLYSIVLSVKILFLGIGVACQRVAGQVSIFFLFYLCLMHQRCSFFTSKIFVLPPPLLLTNHWNPSERQWICATIFHFQFPTSNCNTTRVNNSVILQYLPTVFVWGPWGQLMKIWFYDNLESHGCSASQKEKKRRVLNLETFFCVLKTVWARLLSTCFWSLNKVSAMSPAQPPKPQVVFRSPKQSLRTAAGLKSWLQIVALGRGFC